MASYRTKPCVIEAFKFDPSAKAADLPEWGWKLLGHYPERFNAETGEWKIHTLEGVMTARPGDYIVKGLIDEVYPCKAEAFEKKYELNH